MNHTHDHVKEVDPHFFSLVLSLSSAAMQQLGKIPNPMSQKVEKNLVQAQMTIDMLLMVKNKTAGNLSPKEDQLIKSSLSDLQLNYADEVEKANKSRENAAKEEPPQKDQQT
ncbi:MAG: DUF1844 domain-containing protein [bacterium]